MTFASLDTKQNWISNLNGKDDSVHFASSSIFFDLLKTFQIKNLEKI